MRFFSNIRADLETYDGDWSAQGFWAMLIYRFGRWRYTLRPAAIRKPFSLVYKILFKLVQIACGIELPCEVPMGRHFRMDHFGGIIISGYARFGDHCIVRNGVTIGLKNLDEKCAPHIGNHVNIGAGAKLLGPIIIGDHVDIGANAVVITDVPDNCIAVGIPAVIKPKRGSTTGGPQAFMADGSPLSTVSQVAGP
ncbi:MAG: serine acetyltransferase [Desulfobacterales bacterium]|nr:serine acetyltransferase [Desulfobacterales bacterium]